MGIFITFGLFNKVKRNNSLVEMPGLNVCKVCLIAEANKFFKKIYCSLQKLQWILFLFLGLLMGTELQMPSFIDTILGKRVGEGLMGFNQTQSHKIATCHAV